MAIENATDIVLQVSTDGTEGNLQSVAYTTSASLSMTLDLRDSTTKSSEGWSESLGGLKSWELSGDGFVELADTVTDIDPYTGASGTLMGFTKLWDLWLAGAEIYVKFGRSAKHYEGTAIISSLSADAGVEENASFSLSLTGTGALVQTD